MAYKYLRRELLRFPISVGNIVAIIPITDYNRDNWEVYVMEYLTTTEMSKIWNLSTRRIGVLCSEGRIDGAVKKGKMWLLPADSKKPADARFKKEKSTDDKCDKLK